MLDVPRTSRPRSHFRFRCHTNLGDSTYRVTELICMTDEHDGQQLRELKLVAATGRIGKCLYRSPVSLRCTGSAIYGRCEYIGDPTRLLAQHMGVDPQGDRRVGVAEASRDHMNRYACK